MKPVTDLLVPLDGSPIALESLGVAMWLGTHLGARVHILNAGEPLPLDQALTRLGVGTKYRTHVEVHQVTGPPVEAILAGVEHYHVQLVIMTARGESAASGRPDDAKVVGHVTRAVIERTPIPVLVLPPHYREALPWRSALVPLSGEAETDESLTVALQLAHRLDLRVTIAHVAGRAGRGPEAASRRYVDQAHHEFAQMLDQMVAAACPMCSLEERMRIEAFHLAQGEIGEQLLHIIEQKNIGLLVVGWRGEFQIGHAQVLKQLVRQIRCPVLLVKPGARARFSLKVGEAFA